MRCSPVSASPNVISTIGSTSSAALPMSPTYSSRPSISSSTIAAWLNFSWTNFTRSARLASSSTTDACAMPTDASSSSGLTISGKRSSDGRTGFSPGWHSANAGTRIPWYARIFLVSDLLRATSSAVENDLRPEAAQAIEQRWQVLLHPQQADVVAVLEQRPGHVVLRFLDLRFHLLLVVGVLPFGMQRVEDDGDLHVLTLAMSFPTVVSAIRISRPPRAPAVGRSSIAGRNPIRSER